MQMHNSEALMENSLGGRELNTVGLGAVIFYCEVEN
jgi:hypothetical protein